ncbi:hypothetical protein [Robertmurraya sp. P23]|uniref:hypothetical protein n=1 Tax=Robertmurraya sp. P23 TaxID=3436931 RepID=UPI003D96E3FA
MGRYISIFFMTLLIAVVLFFTLSLIGNIFEDIEVTIGVILVVLGAFIISQLFNILDLIKKNYK